MPWNIVARALFVAAVAWAAALLRPFHPLTPVNGSIGALLGIIVVSLIYAMILVRRDPGVGERVGSIVADE